VGRPLGKPKIRVASQGRRITWFGDLSNESRNAAERFGTQFDLAIDSKLRGCDVVAVRADDVASNGYTLDRATFRQKKTGRPVRFELTEQTRQAIDEYLRVTRRRPAAPFANGW
jgi:hypothetical protein